MILEEFLSRHEFLYHLTSVENARNILASRELLSTKEILRQSNLTKKDQQVLLTERRPEHVYVSLGEAKIMIRDQQPVSIKSLNRTLTDGWSAEQFIESINSRVFFWPNSKRLVIHFNRYSAEAPKIIRVRSRDMIMANQKALRFCHLNSGATRCHPKWSGPPPRGAGTFASIEDFKYDARDVAEVTFEGSCVLPKEIFTGNSPEGPWRSVTLNH